MQPVEFDSTRWSLIEGLNDPSPERVRASMEQLARIYRPCIVSHIQRLVRREDLAEDLTQGFFADVILGRRLLDGAERREGEPLRCLIYTAIRRYIADHFRRTAARSPRQGAAEVALDAHGDQPSQHSVTDFEGSFHRQWATDVVNEALRRTRAYLESRGMERHWALFEAWHVAPLISHTRPAPMKELALKLGFLGGAAGSAAVQEVSRRWELIIREVLAETVRPDLVESELQFLKQRIT